MMKLGRKVLLPVVVSFAALCPACQTKVDNPDDEGSQTMTKFYNGDVTLASDHPPVYVDVVF